MAGVNDMNAPAKYANTRILVVDDMSVNTMILGKVLRHYGCRPDSAADGTEALQKMAAQQYDVIFMDCYMPEMSGFEATRIIREATGHDMAKPVIIALTGDIMNADRNKCLEAGMNDFMSKPFSADQIDAMLKKWVH